MVQRTGKIEANNGVPGVPNLDSRSQGRLVVEEGSSETGQCAVVLKVMSPKAVAYVEEATVRTICDRRISQNHSPPTRTLQVYNDSDTPKGRYTTTKTVDLLHGCCVAWVAAAKIAQASTGIEVRSATFRPRYGVTICRWAMDNWKWTVG